MSLIPKNLPDAIVEIHKLFNHLIDQRAAHLKLLVHVEKLEAVLEDLLIEKGLATDLVVESDDAYRWRLYILHLPAGQSSFLAKMSSIKLDDYGQCAGVLRKRGFHQNE